MLVDYLDILKSLSWCHNVNITILKPDMDEVPNFDLGIRQTLLQPGEKQHFLDLIYHSGNKSMIYYVRDYFEAEFCIIRIPEEEKAYGDYILLGPYLDSYMSEVGLNELMEEKSIPRGYVNELKEYYHAVPIISNIGQWRELCIHMAGVLCQSKTPIHAEYVRWDSLESEFQQGESQDILSFRMIEERYHLESLILKAVSNGNTEEALRYLNQIGKYKISARYKDPIRDQRNGLIIASTLWRKAAEEGCVHPAHIDALSTQVAKRVETINSMQEVKRFMPEMLRKYCMLVRNYSLKGCSPVIQKVVNHINLNLASDLSLKKLAEEYSVNSSYLSALFKKEMGVTITDYISHQRVSRAIKLLNSTNMQIQDIASESGIYDVNYFRKIFKKITGKTPTEYAKQVHRPS